MQGLHKEKLIRHASGDQKKTFLYGFYLFYIVPDKSEKGNNFCYVCCSFELLRLKQPVDRNVFNFKAIFYLFLDEKDSFQPSGDSESFENEFLEVEINPALNWGLSSSNKFSLPIVESEREIGVPHFLCDNIDPDYGEVDADGRYYANNYSLENIVHNLY